MQLEVERISQAYRGRRVLREVSLHLAEGEVGCLLGPSGCGKTTVLRCVAGFEPLLGGEIRVDGLALSRRGFTTPPESRAMGMVFQDYALLPHLSVIDNLLFGLHRWPATERRARAEQVLATVGLSASRDSFPHQLSGGQQQRVALARALAPRPRLLLLDEPFSSLDLGLRQHLRTEVRDILNHYRTTALLVTHDHHDAFAIADQVGVMREGEILQWATPYDLYHRPCDRFVAHFVGQAATLPGRVSVHGGVQIELGLLQGELVQQYPAGTEVDVLLRPDDIVYDEDSPLRVEVRRKVFRGAEILYTLVTPSGSELLALVRSHNDHQLGERIGIRLDADQIVVFAR